MLPEVRQDPLGFPMVWVDEVQKWFHWYPVSKLQFETFLCDVLDETFDARWYKDAREHNPRIPTASVSRDNYWQAFMTGISSQEAQRFARWYGDAYRLPRSSEWLGALAALRKAVPLKAPLTEPVTFANQRFRALLECLNRALLEEYGKQAPRSLAETMLFDRGILEWVLEPAEGSKASGFGSPHPKFFSNLKQPEVPVRPLADERINYWPFGMRLVYDPLLAQNGGSMS